MTRIRTNFIYDPARQGYDTTSIWKTLVGTPTVVADRIVLNQASIVQYADLYGCDLSMRLIIPGLPALGQEKAFGLSSIAFNEHIVFLIRDTDFMIAAINKDGIFKIFDVPFDPAWVGTETDFEIRWRGTYADFLINGIKPIIYRINDISIPKNTLSIALLNENNDDLEIVSISANNIQTFI